MRIKCLGCSYLSPFEVVIRRMGLRCTKLTVDNKKVKVPLSLKERQATIVKENTSVIVKRTG